MIDLSKPSEVTGLRRAFHELSVGISAQHCVQEMQEALVRHCMRAAVSRFVLDISGAFTAPFHNGGKLNS